MEYAKRGLEVPEEEDQEYSRKPKKGLFFISSRYHNFFKKNFLSVLKSLLVIWATEPIGVP